MKISLRKMALVLAMISAGPAALAADGDKNGYLTDSSKEVVRSGFGLCWHTGFWTPADAIEGCDGAIAKSEKDAGAGAAAAAAAPAGAKSGGDGEGGTVMNAPGMTKEQAREELAQALERVGKNAMAQKVRKGGE
jgi:hypothetical protein